MSNGFKSNYANIRLQLTNNRLKPLEALGSEFPNHALQEMDRLIYNAPLPKSAENNPHYRRTGRLRAGQTFDVNVFDGEVVVGNVENYAVHVHFAGVTRNWGGLPWMLNVINNKQRELKDILVNLE